MLAPVGGDGASAATSSRVRYRQRPLATLSELQRANRHAHESKDTDTGRGEQSAKVEVLAFVEHNFAPSVFLPKPKFLAKEGKARSPLRAALRFVADGELGRERPAVLTQFDVLPRLAKDWGEPAFLSLCRC